MLAIGCSSLDSVDCSAIQPGGAWYQQNNLSALASYAYRLLPEDGQHRRHLLLQRHRHHDHQRPKFRILRFHGKESTLQLSVPVGASPPTNLSPSTGFTPPVGSSPPSSSEFAPPVAGTTPPSGSDLGPGFGTPSGSFNGTGSFRPSGTLNPYNGVSRGLPRVGLFTALSAAAVAVLLVSMDAM
eukprot:XP_020402832.1 uncharacterized protein LOC109943748 [Zea mays]